MRTVRLIAVCAVLSFAMGAPAAVTKHYSFSNGYPTTTTRQPTTATVGTFGADVGVSGSTRSSPSSEKKERELVGKVVRVDAGDLIWVTPTGGSRTKVRLLRVDAPEQGQPYGVEAKKFLFGLVNGREVTVRYMTRDRSGAVLGTVFLPHEKGLVDVNLTMLKNGCAWYEQPAKSAVGASGTAQEKTYSAAQDEARGANRGLWQAPNPVKPSEWRKLRKYATDPIQL